MEIYTITILLFLRIYTQYLVRKWRELAPFFLAPPPPRHYFFTLAPSRRAPPFIVRASGVVALKVAQVPSTGDVVQF